MSFIRFGNYMINMELVTYVGYRPQTASTSLKSALNIYFSDDHFFDLTGSEADQMWAYCRQQFDDLTDIAATEEEVAT